MYMYGIKTAVFNQFVTWKHQQEVVYSVLSVVGNLEGQFTVEGHMWSCKLLIHKQVVISQKQHIKVSVTTMHVQQVVTILYA